MNLDNLKQRMALAEQTKVRGPSAKHLINMALEHNGSSAKAAALIILSLEADNWFKFSAIELVHFDHENRQHANNVLLGIEPSDFMPSRWLERLNMDVKSEINELIEKWSSLRVN